MVGGPSRRSRIGRGTLPEVRKWSGYHPKGPEVVEGPFQRLEVVGGPSRWPGSGRGPIQRSVSGRGTLLEGRKWLGDLLGGPKVVGGTSQNSGSGQRTLPEVQK